MAGYARNLDLLPYAQVTILYVACFGASTQCFAPATLVFYVQQIWFLIRIPPAKDCLF